MKSYPIYLKQGAILVRVSAKGPKGIEEAELILDTGASQTIISKSVANTIGCGAKERSGYKAITTAKGIIDAEAYRIHSFKSSV